jgi:tetratricopeptide (TPR) repeat protein
MERAQNLERQGRLDEAMAEFKRALEADPRMAAAHNALGQHYLRKGLVTKAADEFHSAVLLGPNYDTCFNLGRAFADLSRYAEAANAFRQCLSFVADDPSARYELAYAQYAQGRFAEALAQFQSLLVLYPEDTDLHLAIASCYMGVAEFAPAVEALQKALQCTPPNVDATAIHESLDCARRHLELPAQQSASVKDRLYGDYGVVCLGSSRDDGLDVPLYHNHRFTYTDVAVSLSRLAALVHAYDWRFDSLIAVDADSEALGKALSKLLAVPMLKLSDLTERNQVLVVVGLARSRELCEVTLERIPGIALSFAFALDWLPNEGALADVVGVHCTGSCTLPWQRVGSRASMAAASILGAIASVPQEANLQEQIQYYTQNHRRLCFLQDTAKD